MGISEVTEVGRREGPYGELLAVRSTDRRKLGFE